MSRRQDLLGIPRHTYQGFVNRKLAATYVENERGWRVPNTVEEGWSELNRAIYTTRRTLMLLKHMSPYERADSIRSVRFELARSAACPPSPLPSAALNIQQRASE